MYPQNRAAKIHDVIAGTVLLLTGSIALFIRLGFLDASRIPTGLLHWWPLLLIIAGLVLWYAQMEQAAELHERRVSEVKHGM
jgi:hypothetical protein